MVSFLALNPGGTKFGSSYKSSSFEKSHIKTFPSPIPVLSPHIVKYVSVCNGLESDLTIGTPSGVHGGGGIIISFPWCAAIMAGNVEVVSIILNVSLNHISQFTLSELI